MGEQESARGRSRDKVDYIVNWGMGGGRRGENNGEGWSVDSKIEHSFESDMGIKIDLLYYPKISTKLESLRFIKVYLYHHSENVTWPVQLCIGCCGRVQLVTTRKIRGGRDVVGIGRQMMDGWKSH